MKKLILLLLIVLAVPVTMMADDPVEIDGIYYELIPKGGVARVTGLTPDITNVVIPNNILYEGSTYTVNEIRSLVGANSINSLEIPASIEIMSSSMLLKITNYGIYSNCENLKSIKVEDGNTKYCSPNNCNAIIETASGKLILGCSQTVIPNYVTEIGDYAFAGSCIEHIDLNGITTIGYRAFANLGGLSIVENANSLVTIGNEAFIGCSSLAYIEFPNSLKSIGDAAFMGCGLKSIVIPDNVVNLESQAFWNCTQAEYIIIGDNVPGLGIYTFAECENVRFVVLGAGITNISTHAFVNNKNLTHVICKADTPPSADNAFIGCDVEYSKLYVNDDAVEAYQGWCNFGEINPLSGTSFVVADCYAREYGDNNPDHFEYKTFGATLNGEPNVECLAVASTPASITNREYYPITLSQGSISNSDVVYINGTLDIQKAPMDIKVFDCTYPFGSEMTFHASYQGFKNNDTEETAGAWLGTDEITGTGQYEIYVGGLSDNYYEAHSESGILTVVDALQPGELFYLYNDNTNEAIVRACGNGENLNITIPTTVNHNGQTYSVTEIGEAAFYGCDGIENVTIPSSVRSIGNCAFYGCNGLASLKIPTSVTTIGNTVIGECENIKSIIIPSSVTSIKEGVFSFSSLESILVDASNCKYDSRNNCNAIIESATNTLIAGCKNTIIPNDVMVIGNSAFNSMDITSIDIPNSVTTIGESAFENNVGLTSINIPNSVTTIGSYALNTSSSMDVTCHATTPPSCDNSLFGGNDLSEATLYVPSTSIGIYSTTEPWSGFGTITSLSTVVTANSYEREYGDENPDFEWTVEGASLDGTPNRICDADETSAPGEYPIVISQGTETNTNVTYVNGTLTITKAPLTITANSYTIKEGDPLPSYDAVFTGLKNNESESVVNPDITCTATDSNTPGTYDINVTATSDNYDITIEAGTLTILPTKMSITIGAPGVGTYCSPYDLDFSTVTDFKAYIATGYNSATGNVIVQAVKDVPAGTGLFLKGTPGTYDVPCGESSSYYVNMLVGVTEATTISATDGNMTNFLLSATNSSDACFRPISSTYNLKANRAYLQIPTSMVSSSAGANSVGIEFEEGVTGIDNSLSDMDANAHWFTLDGRRLNGKPTQKGIYVVNGQKVVIK
ncbi:MAG: leucine-rich repeat protein [Prevotella sp.]|nr:leucine-rich repeat protein [Prevotella sp.]